MGLGLGFVAAGVVKELMVVVLWRLGAGATTFGDGLWVWPWVCGLWPWVMGGLGRFGLIFCICGVRVAGMGVAVWVADVGVVGFVFRWVL